MKKWLVIVNKKWLVSVEADTNGWAENLALDAVHGDNSTALAFDPETEAGLETYRTLMAECETISYGELCNMRNCKAALELENMNERIALFEQALRESRELDKQLLEAHKRLLVERWDTWVTDMRELTKQVNEANMEVISRGEAVRSYVGQTGLREVTVPAKVIKELRESHQPLNLEEVYKFYRIA